MEDEDKLTFDIAGRKSEAFDRARTESASSSVVQVTTVQQSREHASNTSNAANRACYRCSSESHIASSMDCPVRQGKCNNCAKIGHYANVKIPISQKNKLEMRSEYPFHVF